MVEQKTPENRATHGNHLKRAKNLQRKMKLCLMSKKANICCVHLQKWLKKWLNVLNR